MNLSVTDSSSNKTSISPQCRSRSAQDKKCISTITGSESRAYKPYTSPDMSDSPKRNARSRSRSKQKFSRQSSPKSKTRDDSYHTKQRLGSPPRSTVRCISNRRARSHSQTSKFNSPKSTDKGDKRVSPKLWNLENREQELPSPPSFASVSKTLKLSELEGKLRKIRSVSKDRSKAYNRSRSPSKSKKKGKSRSNSRKRSLSRQRTPSLSRFNSKYQEKDKRLKKSPKTASYLTRLSPDKPRSPKKGGSKSPKSSSPKKKRDAGKYSLKNAFSLPSTKKETFNWCGKKYSSVPSSPKKLKSHHKEGSKGPRSGRWKKLSTSVILPRPTIASTLRAIQGAQNVLSRQDVPNVLSRQDVPKVLSRQDVQNIVSLKDDSATFENECFHEDIHPIGTRSLVTITERDCSEQVTRSISEITDRGLGQNVYPSLTSVNSKIFSERPSESTYYTQPPTKEDISDKDYSISFGSLRVSFRNPVSRNTIFRKNHSLIHVAGDRCIFPVSSTSLTTVKDGIVRRTDTAMIKPALSLPSRMVKTYKDKHESKSISLESSKKERALDTKLDDEVKEEVPLEPHKSKSKSPLYKSPEPSKQSNLAQIVKLISVSKSKQFRSPYRKKSSHRTRTPENLLPIGEWIKCSSTLPTKFQESEENNRSSCDKTSSESSSYPTVIENHKPITNTSILKKSPTLKKPSPSTIINADKGKDKDIEQYKELIKDDSDDSDKKRSTYTEEITHCDREITPFHKESDDEEFKNCIEYSDIDRIFSKPSIQEFPFSENPCVEKNKSNIMSPKYTLFDNYKSDSLEPSGSNHGSSVTNVTSWSLLNSEVSMVSFMQKTKLNKKVVNVNRQIKPFTVRYFKRPLISGESPKKQTKRSLLPGSKENVAVTKVKPDKMVRFEDLERTHENVLKTDNNCDVNKKSLLKTIESNYLKHRCCEKITSTTNMEVSVASIQNTESKNIVVSAGESVQMSQNFYGDVKGSSGNDTVLTSIVKRKGYTSKFWIDSGMSKTPNVKHKVVPSTNLNNLTPSLPKGWTKIESSGSNLYCNISESPVLHSMCPSPKKNQSSISPVKLKLRDNRNSSNDAIPNLEISNISKYNKTNNNRNIFYYPEMQNVIKFDLVNTFSENYSSRDVIFNTLEGECQCPTNNHCDSPYNNDVYLADNLCFDSPTIEKANTPFFASHDESCLDLKQNVKKSDEIVEMQRIPHNHVSGMSRKELQNYGDCESSYIKYMEPNKEIKACNLANSNPKLKTHSKSYVCSNESISTSVNICFTDQNIFPDRYIPGNRSIEALSIDLMVNQGKPVEPILHRTVPKQNRTNYKPYSTSLTNITLVRSKNQVMLPSSRSSFNLSDNTYRNDILENETSCKHRESCSTLFWLKRKKNKPEHPCDNTDICEDSTFVLDYFSEKGHGNETYGLPTISEKSEFSKGGGLSVDLETIQSLPESTKINEQAKNIEIFPSLSDNSIWSVKSTKTETIPDFSEHSRGHELSTKTETISNWSDCFKGGEKSINIEAEATSSDKSLCCEQSTKKETTSNLSDHFKGSENWTHIETLPSSTDNSLRCELSTKIETISDSLDPSKIIGKLVNIKSIPNLSDHSKCVEKSQSTESLPNSFDINIGSTQSINAEKISILSNHSKVGEQSKSKETVPNSSDSSLCSEVSTKAELNMSERSESSEQLISTEMISDFSDKSKSRELLTNTIKASSVSYNYKDKQLVNIETVSNSRESSLSLEESNTVYSLSKEDLTLSNIKSTFSWEEEDQNHKIKLRDSKVHFRIPSLKNLKKSHLVESVPPSDFFSIIGFEYKSQTTRSEIVNSQLLNSPTRLRTSFSSSDFNKFEDTPKTRRLDNSVSQQIPILKKLFLKSHTVTENSITKARSEDDVRSEKEWLQTEKMWLLHRGGFSEAQLLRGDTAGLSEGKVRVRLESGDVIEVDEDDIEKANPPQFDRTEDLTSLRYLNESSTLHTLRQRYGANLIHTYAGPHLVVVNPSHQLPIYAEKVMQMLRGCKQEDMPPHIFSMAQMLYRDMLNTRKDQSLLLVGRSGTGKTTNAQHVMHYLVTAGTASSSVVTSEKLVAVFTLLQAFGNCRTSQNVNASRFTQVFTLDFDHTGQLGAASVQALMFEKTRVVRRPDGEPTFSIFYQMLAGLDQQLRNELQVQALSENNLFMTPLQKSEDKERASEAWTKNLQAFNTLSFTDEEIKTILCVLSAIYHLGNAGASKGANNKPQFSKAVSAQRAAALLGVSVEELSKSIFTTGGTSTLSRSTSLRVSIDRPAYMTPDANASPLECLEGFVIGLYSDVFNALLSLINRSLSSGVRAINSITIVDAPGFQTPASSGNSRGTASFEDLCHNYTHERLQTFFHEYTIAAPQETYQEEDIELDFEVTTTPSTNMVSLLDKPPQQGLGRGGGSDNTDKKGLLWILDEEAVFPGATEDSFMERLLQQHSEQPVRKDSLLRKGSLGKTFILNHNLGTCPVQYNAQGWLRACRENPTSRNASLILQDSKKQSISQLFTSVKGQGHGLMGGSIAGMEGSTSLKRVGSMRRTFVSGQAGLKKKSIALQVKFNVDSILDILKKTKVHFVHCLLPQLASSAEKGQALDEGGMNVPLVRNQLRGMQLLDATRLYRQGFPDSMLFGDFINKFAPLVPSLKLDRNDSDEKLASTMILENLDVDKLNYRCGNFRVFFRPGCLGQLDLNRDEKFTGVIEHFQAVCRGYLARRRLDKLKVQQTAIRCIQRNVKKYVQIREWDWWKLYTKVKPILNVHRTEEELREREAEIELLKARSEKLEKERAEYKAQCDKLEARLSEVAADLAEENTTSNEAAELLEAETGERMRLEKEVKDLQARLTPLKRQNEKLQMELMRTRLWQAESLEDDLDDREDDKVYKPRYERIVRELQMTKKQLHQQHEEEMEAELSSRKVLERRLHEAVAEAEEQRRQVQVAKKKCQRLTAETQDTKLHLEEQMARNNELERKQRRFDSELSMTQEDVREEKTMREKLQRERDELMSEKYALEQSLQQSKMEAQSVQDKAERLEKEMNDLLVTGKDNNEVVVLKRSKHELELKLQEQEEELDDQAGQIQQLTQAKLRLEMNMEKTKSQHGKELEEKEEELEEMRYKNQKKLRQLESQVEEEYEHKKRVMEEKSLLERQLQEMGSRGTDKDRESEKRLRRNLRKTRALLNDASNTLMKQKDVDAIKSQVNGLRNQLDDAQYASAAAIKAKKRMEQETMELQQQIEELTRSKQEAENKYMSVMREKSDIQSRMEELEEDEQDIMKKYKASVQQQTVDQITLTDQVTQIEELTTERDSLKQQVYDLQSKLETFQDSMVDKHAMLRLETKGRDLESRLQLEATNKQRIEAQLSRQKEQVERLTGEKEELNMAKMSGEEANRRLQKQLRELREEFTEVQKHELEAEQRKKELESEVERLEENHTQMQSDLKLALKRITDLQAALEYDLDEDSDVILSGDSEDDEDLSEDEDLDAMLDEHRQAAKSSVNNPTHKDYSLA